VIGEGEAEQPKEWYHYLRGRAARWCAVAVCCHIGCPHLDICTKHQAVIPRRALGALHTSVKAMACIDGIVSEHRLHLSLVLRLSSLLEPRRKSQRFQLCTHARNIVRQLINR